jgi:hypothetical protein
LKPKLAEILFRNLVRAAIKKQHFNITKLKWLIFFKEIIDVYPEKNKGRKFEPIYLLQKYTIQFLEQFPYNTGATVYCSQIS